MDGPTKDEGRWAGRFYVKVLPGQGARPELRGAEAAHAAGSRRARPGDTVTLFDGSGCDLNALVVEAGRGRLVLREISREMVGAPLAAGVVCAAALPKGSREDALVCQCAQLGVSRFVPVEFERSVVRPRGNWQKRAARLSRLAVEAAKQSGASTIMEIAPPEKFAAFLERESTALKLVCHKQANESPTAALEAAWPFAELVYLVGPEGGLTPGESAEAAAAGFRAVRLAATTLRIETAAAAFAAIAAAFLTARPRP